MVVVDDGGARLGDGLDACGLDGCANEVCANEVGPAMTVSTAGGHGRLASVTG